MLKIHSTHHIELSTIRLFAFHGEVIKSVGRRFIKLYRAVDDPLEELMERGFTIAVFTVNDGHFAVSRTANLSMIPEVPEVFVLNALDFH